MERAGYEKAGDALGLHRSKKHFQIWGDALAVRPPPAQKEHVSQWLMARLVLVNLIKTGLGSVFGLGVHSR